MARQIKQLSERHIQAWEYYLKLGPERSYTKVAEHMGVKLDTVQAWGSFFGWRKKLSELLKENNEMLISELWGVVGDVRKRAIRISDYATMWTQEMAEILSMGVKDKRELTKKEDEQVKRIRNALAKLDGKLLKDITSYFKENVQFEAEGKTSREREDEAFKRGKADGPTFTGPTLVIMHSRKGGKRKDGEDQEENGVAGEEARRVIELLPAFAGNPKEPSSNDREAPRDGENTPHQGPKPRSKSLWGWEEDAGIS